MVRVKIGVLGFQGSAEYIRNPLAQCEFNDLNSLEYHSPHFCIQGVDIKD